MLKTDIKNQLEYECYAVIAVSSIYGVDLLQNNVKEARERLFDIFNEQYSRLSKDNRKENYKKTIKYILRGLNNATYIPLTEIK